MNAPTKRALTVAAHRADRARRRASIESLMRALSADDVYADTCAALGFDPLAERQAS